MEGSSGIVMQIDKKYAHIMTNQGEFIKVKIGKIAPTVGEIYSAEKVKQIPFYKYTAAAASIAFTLLFGGVAYAYYSPVATVDININPSIRLDINRWEKIIKSMPLNTDGEKVLASLDIKNKALNDGLELIVDEAKKDNFINEAYIESGKVITLSVDNNKSNLDVDLSKFENYSKQNNLKVEITEDKKNNNINKKNNKAKPTVPSNNNNSNKNKEDNSSSQDTKGNTSNPNTSAPKNNSNINKKNDTNNSKKNDTSQIKNKNEVKNNIKTKDDKDTENKKNGSYDKKNDNNKNNYNSKKEKPSKK